MAGSQVVYAARQSEQLSRVDEDVLAPAGVRAARVTVRDRKSRTETGGLRKETHEAIE